MQSTLLAKRCWHEVALGKSTVPAGCGKSGAPGPVSERYINSIFDLLEGAVAGAAYQPMDNNWMIGEGRYELVGRPDEGTLLRDGAPYDHPTEAEIREALTTPWQWEVIAEILDGSIWRVGDIRAFSPAEMNQLRIPDLAVAAHLELRSVGHRWGRLVAEFAIKIEEDNEQVLSRDHLMYIDSETVRPIVHTYTLRARDEAVTADGVQYFTAYHRRFQRSYRFPDIPLYNPQLKLIPSGFETPGNNNRAPIDIGVPGKGDALYIHERAKGTATASDQDLVGAWDIYSKKPVATRSLSAGKLYASRSSEGLHLRNPHWITTYFLHGPRIVTQFQFFNGGLDVPALTASADIGSYNLTGDDSGRVRLGHIGWHAQYGSIQVSQAPILAIAASQDQGDTGQFATMDGLGDVRRHGIAANIWNSCRIGSELFDMHCNGLLVDIDATRPLANVSETGCVSAMSETLVIAPKGEMIGWTDFEAIDGECVRTGSSWLIETRDGSPRKVAGSGLTFVDDRQFLTGAGVFERSSMTPTVTFESELPDPVDFQREVLKAVVSDRHQTAYFLIDQDERPKYVVEVDLRTGVVVPIWTRDLNPQPTTLGISNAELFTLMSDGSVISESVTDGRIDHFWPATADGSSMAARQRYREARMLDDRSRLALTVVNPLGLDPRVLQIASAANPRNILSDDLQLAYLNWAKASDSNGETIAVAGSTWLAVSSPGLLPNRTELVDRIHTIGKTGVSVAVSGRGDTTRVVITGLDRQNGRTTSLDVYAVTSGGLVLDRTIPIEEALPDMAVAGSAAHTDIVIGPLRPDPTNSPWHPKGEFLRRVSLETGTNVGEVFSEWDGTPKIDFSPDGTYLLQVTTNGALRVYDMDLGMDLGTLVEQPGAIATMRTTSSGEWVTQGGTGITKVWDFDFIDVASEFSDHHNAILSFLTQVDNHALRATILPPDAVANEAPRGAFIFTSDGYYSGDRSRLAELSFADRSGNVAFEKYDLIANRPDITLSRLGLVSEADRLRLFDAVRRRQARYITESVPKIIPEDATLSVSAGLSEGASWVTEAELLPIEISLETSHSIRELVIRVNGTPVFRSSDELASTTLEFNAPLQAGRNTITVDVRSDLGLLSSSQPLSVVRVGAPEPSRLHVFAVGVSDYQDDTLDLSYAAKDAQDLVSYLQSVKSDVVAKVVVDNKVDRSTLGEARTFFRAARPGDRAIFFLSGHGFLDEQMKYYFAAHTFDKSSPATGGFAMEDIDSVFDGSVVLNRAILIDTCHAGDFDEEQGNVEIATLDNGLVVRGTKGFESATTAPRIQPSSAYSTMKSVFADLNTRSGAHVLAASGGLEYSVEGPQWRNGVFTYSLLQALESGEADFDQDGFVEIRELGSYVSQSVASLTAYRQVPSSRSTNVRNNFRVAAVPRP